MDNDQMPIGFALVADGRPEQTPERPPEPPRRSTSTFLWEAVFQVRIAKVAELVLGSLLTLGALLALSYVL